MVVLILDDLIYKQTLIPLTPKGVLLILKIGIMVFQQILPMKKEELEKKDLINGQNRTYQNRNVWEKPFDKDLIKNILNHENIENLKGLEVDLFINGKLGSMLIFDRTIFIVLHQ